MRVVIDTNILVSAHIAPSGSPAQVLDAWIRKQIRLLISPAILAEYERILRRPRIASRHGLSPSEISAVIDDLRELGTIVHVTSQLNVITQDPTDNKFIECAVDGEAEYIVSGDHHLLTLGVYNGIQIVRPDVFLMLLVL